MQWNVMFFNIIFIDFSVKYQSQYEFNFTLSKNKLVHCAVIIVTIINNYLDEKKNQKQFFSFQETIILTSVKSMRLLSHKNCGDIIAILIV